MAESGENSARPRSPSVKPPDVPQRRRPTAATGINDVGRKLTKLRNDLILNLPAIHAHTWIEDGIRKLDNAIASIGQNRLDIKIDVHSSEDENQVLSRLLANEVEEINAEANEAEPFLVYLHSGAMNVHLLRRGDEAQPIGVEPSAYIKVVSAPYIDRAATHAAMLNSVLQMNNEEGALTIDRETFFKLFDHLKRNEKSWSDSTSSLHAIHAVSVAENFVDSCFPASSTIVDSGNEHFNEDEENYDGRKRLFLFDVDDRLNEVEQRFEESLDTSAASAGAFFLATKAQIAHFVSKASLDEEPEPSVAAMFKLRWLVKYLYKHKSKIRVKNSTIIELSKSMEKILASEIDKSERMLQRAYKKITDSAETHNLQSALFGLDEIPVARAHSSSGRSKEIKLHLSSALKAVSGSFEIDHEFKGLIGRLFEARMAMLSIMMMVFMFGRAFDEVDLIGGEVKIYLYMLYAIGIFAVLSGLMSPFVHRIERNKAIEKLKASLADRLSSASDRAFSLSIGDLNRELELLRKRIQRNVKTLDQVLQNERQDKTKQKMVSAVTKLRSESIMATGEKARAALARLRGEQALKFAESAFKSS